MRRQGELDQRSLAALFADVLGVERVEDHDDFFALGGTSLLSIVLLERLHEEHGVEVPLDVFYEEPTPLGLRRALDGHRATPHRTLAELLAAAAADAPGRPAVLAADGTVSFGELARIAAGADDLRAAAPVALRLHTSAGGARAIVEMLASRRPFVLLAPSATEEEERRALTALEAELADGSRTAGDSVYAVATSGSTGRPKIVVIPHDALLALRPVQVERYGIEPTDAMLLTAPLHYGYGLNSGLLTPLVGGAAVVLVERPLTPRSAEAAAERVRITVALGVSSAYRFLLAARPRLPGLRLALVGGDPLPAALAESWAAWSGVPLVDGYGTSETDHVSNNELQVPGSVGRPLSAVEVAVATEQGDRLPAGDGELVVRSPAMARCYAGDPAQSAQRWRDGWFHTGDLAHVDDDGNVFLRGRLDDQLQIGGATVDPHEVEAVCREELALADCAVVGRPMPGGGTELCAFVVADRPVTARDVRTAARRRLSDHKVPTRVVQVDALPRGANGKLLRRVLAGDGDPG